jgi:acyl carrier protein
MNQQEIIEKMKPILAIYAKDKEALAQLNLDTSFIKDLKVNSANLVDIVLDVEEAFDIEIDNDSMEQMLTVGAAIQIVQTKLK